MARKGKADAAARPAVALAPAAAVVLYDRKTGAIFGTHYFGATEGVELPGQDELERIAFEQAARDGCRVRQVKALHVDPAKLKPGCNYAVSVKTRKPSLMERKRSGKRRTRSIL
jgi:hypothetical protein